MAKEKRGRQHRVSGNHRRNNGVYGQRGEHSNNGCFPVIIIMVAIPIILVSGGLAIFL